eukprot:NODE_6652_length_513_cov_5.204663_g6486_i0.p1 GENE.NODE_6652_length_513_cov_5.204663_g6486_i0~~NODE_6652_length_513_cov_5.204663_g6486_i0.p1  ORF type:complete len:162 (+),score=38.67 NODE_6652_length_513_cov_5.204663_g6486_i0:40-486(+)
MLSRPFLPRVVSAVRGPLNRRCNTTARHFNNQLTPSSVRLPPKQRRYSTRPPIPDTWWERFVVCLVFAITGSSIMFLVRPLMQLLGMQGSLKEGPNTFRLAYVLLVTPIYSCMLVVVGYCFGRGPYFRRFALNMWRRFLPKSVFDRLK